MLGLVKGYMQKPTLAANEAAMRASKQRFVNPGNSSIGEENGECSGKQVLTCQITGVFDGLCGRTNLAHIKGLRKLMQVVSL